MKPQPLIVIVGPTASGKSALAHNLALKYKGEIIAADARTVYKGMDIGTAKPSLQERKELSYHLLDIRHPSEQYTAAEFKADALKKLAQIGASNKLAFMVGGSGLYIDGVIFDYNFAAKTDENIRTKIQQLTPEELMLELNNRGIEFDHNETKNLRRLQRLLEVGYKNEQRSEPRPNTLLLGLDIDRAELRDRIERRVTWMMRHGLRREAESLAGKYGWHAPGLNAIGYREWQPYFEGQISKAEVGRRIVRSTLALARRQRTWFKRHRMIHWISSDKEASQQIEEFLGI